MASAIRLSSSLRQRLLLPLGVGGVLILLATAYRIGLAFAGSHPEREDAAELTCFPNGRLAGVLAMGRERLAADFAWLQAIQYYGRHRMTDRRYPYAERLFRTMTALDPSFEEAYVFGALVLADRGADPAAARGLLREGMLRNPRSWRLPFEYGFLIYLEEKDSREAARYLARASRLPGAPATVGRLAAYAAGQAGQRDLALELWREMLRSSDNEEVRRIARRYLKELGAPEAADFPEEDGDWGRPPGRASSGEKEE